MGHPFVLGWARMAAFLLGEALGLGAKVWAEVAALYDHAEDVFEGEVALLDVHGDVGGDDDVVVAEVRPFFRRCCR